MGDLRTFWIRNFMVILLILLLLFFWCKIFERTFFEVDKRQGQKSTGAPADIITALSHAAPNKSEVLKFHF